MTAWLLTRRVGGDWGELDEHDWREIEFSVANGFRILSAYTLSTGTRIWIIAEEMNLARGALKAHWAEVRDREDPKKSPAFTGLGAVRFLSPLVAAILVVVARTAWVGGVRHYRSTGS